MTYSPVDINLMSKVPEHSDLKVSDKHSEYYGYWEVTLLLTQLQVWRCMTFLLTELVLLTSVWSVMWISKHKTVLKAVGTVASKISSILRLVKQGML